MLSNLFEFIEFSISKKQTNENEMGKKEENKSTTTEDVAKTTTAVDITAAAVARSNPISARRSA